MVKYNYTAYGDCTATLNSEGLAEINPFRYKGYYYDTESGMYYCNSRYYVPEWCRWLTADSPSFLQPESLNGMNLFAYCCNDPVNKIDTLGSFAITISTLVWAIAIGAGVGGGIGFGSAYASDVIGNVKKDGFQWSDFNTFEDNWKHYIGATAGGAVAGAGVGLCSVLGGGAGAAMIAQTSLAIGGVTMSGLSALGVGVGGAFVSGGVGYALRTGISDQEDFEWSDMFVDAGANAISGLLSFAGGFIGGATGIKVPGRRSANFVSYHLTNASLGIYPFKIAISYIKKKLKELF